MEYIIPIQTPPTPAEAKEIPYVISVTWLVFIPQSIAPSFCCQTARTALPSYVLCRNTYRTAQVISARTKLIRLVIGRATPAIKSDLPVYAVVITLGSALQLIKMMFSITITKPDVKTIDEAVRFLVLVERGLNKHL